MDHWCVYIYIYIELTWSEIFRDIIYTHILVTNDNYSNDIYIYVILYIYIYWCENLFDRWSGFVRCAKQIIFLANVRTTSPKHGQNIEESQASKRQNHQGPEDNNRVWLIQPNCQPVDPWVAGRWEKVFSVWCSLVCLSSRFGIWCVILVPYIVYGIDQQHLVRTHYMLRAPFLIPTPMFETRYICMGSVWKACINRCSTINGPFM